MVRAIREGRKTQTRRVVKHQPTLDFHYRGWYMKDTYEWTTCHPLDIRYPKTQRHVVRSPYGVPGDRLYVKEAVWVWCHKKPNGTTKKGRPKFSYVPHSSRSFFYVADHPYKPERTSYADPDMVWRYKTARFMPRWASRITLEVIDVRVQRVQEISKEDAKAEGAAELCEQCGNCPDAEAHWCCDAEYDETAGYRTGFKCLWNSINAKKYPWASNPWVWAITFRRIDLLA